MPASFPWNWTLKAQAGEGEKPMGVEEGSRTLRVNGAQRKEGHCHESDHGEGLVPCPGANSASAFIRTPNPGSDLSGQ